MREYNYRSPDFRSRQTLDQVMRRCDIPGLFGVDARRLNRRGCRVTVLPWDTTAQEITALDPDGVSVDHLTVDHLAKIIRCERPGTLLPGVEDEGEIELVLTMECQPLSDGIQHNKR